MNDTLVTTDWLHTHLGDPNLRIVDIRGHVLPASEPPPHYFNHRDDYEKSHIPGSVFVDWVYEITDPDDPRHTPIAKPQRFAGLMSRIGVGPDTVVVTYDDAAGMFAARLWWCLRYFGHRQVAVLDGGWNKWIAEGRPTNTEIPDVQPKPFLPQPNPDLRWTGEQVLEALHSPVKLVDVRSPQEFAGERSRARRKGHIPGALNLPRPALVAPDGTLLPLAELRKQFAQIGVDETAPQVVFYCNAGVSASFGLLALTVAGLHNGTVYDGSWKDWGNDDRKPVEV